MTTKILPQKKTHRAVPVEAPQPKTPAKRKSCPICRDWDPKTGRTCPAGCTD